MKTNTDFQYTFQGEIYKKKSVMNIYKDKSIKHIFLGNSNHSNINLIISKFFKKYPITFKFIFTSEIKKEEKEQIIKAGNEWSKYLTSYLDEPIVILIKKECLFSNSLAATGNYLVSEKNYKQQISTLQTLAIHQRLEIKNLPLEEKFNIPKDYKIKGYGYSLANLRCLSNTPLKNLKNANEDAEISLNISKCFVHEYNLYSIMLHEIGHVLGFVSGLDEISDDENKEKKISLFILDLYRFDHSDIPTNEIEFNKKKRCIIPNNHKHVFCNLHQMVDMSTGLTENGDGFQASHWKNNDGVMISHIEKSQALEITTIDIQAMMSLGYGKIPNQ